MNANLKNLFNKESFKFSNIAWNIIPPFLFILLVNLLFPIRNIFSFDSDEGINLMKSLLLLRGYPLYSVIWNDQPPLLTYILAGAFKVFGLDVNVGRIVVLFFAALLVWAFTQYLIQISNRWYAVVGLLLLIVLPNFTQLSVSVMIGIPAIALGTVSLLFVTQWHITRKKIWLILAGIVLALSILIKLFTAILVPILILGIVVDEYLSNKQEGKKGFFFSSASLFLFFFSAIFIAGILLLIKPENINQMIIDHLSNFKLFSNLAIFVVPSLTLIGIVVYLINVWRRTKGSLWLHLALSIIAISLATGIILVLFSYATKLMIINFINGIDVKTYAIQLFEFFNFYKLLLLLLALAVIGSIKIIKTKCFLAYYAISLAIAGCAFLCLWRPIWYHHFLLFSIPATILAGIAFGESESILRKSFLMRKNINAWQWIKGFSRHEWNGFFVVLLFIINWGIMGSALLSQADEIKASIQQPNSENQISNELMSQIMNYAPKTHWMVTDSPMFAFRANIVTPPYLAVISHKRIWSGELTKAQLGEAILEWKPELVLFGGKINAKDVIDKYMNPYYTLIYSRESWNLFILNEFNTQTSP